MKELEQRRISRRCFLETAGAVAASLALGAGGGAILVEHQRQARETPLEFLRSQEALTFEGALRFAEMVDRHVDQVVDYMPDLPRSQEALVALTLEIVPYFVYEGIRSPYRQIGEGPGYRVVVPQPPELYPDYLNFRRFIGPENFHVMGRASCQDPDYRAIIMNFRYANPLSPTYRSATYLATLVHELGHVNGVCDDELTMESANQVATIEVLAAMSRHHNIFAYPVFLIEAREFAEDYALYEALTENRMPEFYQYIERVSDDSFDIANFRKSMDFWRGNMDDLEWILNVYGRFPYIFMAEAAQDLAFTTRTLPSLPNQSHHLQMNDTMYILHNIDELSRDYPGLVEEWRSA